MFCMQSRIKVRVVCARAYHALFMHNMMIRPNEQELATFGKPDFTIFNAGAFPVNRYTSYMSSSTSVDVNLRHVMPGSPAVHLYRDMSLLLQTLPLPLQEPYSVCPAYMS